MTQWLKRIGWTLGVLAVLLVAAFVALRTPDTDREAMIAKYSAAGDRFITVADGARIHVRDSGGDGPAMVLLHGSNASLHTWEPLKRELAGYRIVTLDLPGHGLTGATPTHRYDPDEMVAAVDGVVSALGLEGFVLGGNSMGGGISWRYALAHPAKVRALLLIDAAGMPPRAGDKPPASNIGFRIMRSGFGRWLGGQITPRFLIERSLRGSVSNQSVVTDAAVDRYWELLRFPGNREATGIRFARGFADPAAAERIRTISVPTLIIFGSEDRIISPSAAQSFAERIAGSEVIMMDGIGHLPMEEAPQATAEAIRDFLAGN
ncbi:alpha/beta hydrolase [Sphingomonas lacunae]|uniref:Alpha/beta hydrolase n=1 Tax=Sphingomonas lacunae TaxID=2698828 RepID=A0A6M4AU89_9SPHN|nr:alpha/beta hydrolase [Sphingomonas lacunae]QJQ32687.1 alpha/beta hydrolase [Sphingomonas lacunae]